MQGQYPQSSQAIVFDFLSSLPRTASCVLLGAWGADPRSHLQLGEMPQENPLSTQPSLSRITNRLVTSRLPVLDLALLPAVQSDLAPLAGLEGSTAASLADSTVTAHAPSRWSYGLGR